MPRNVQDNRLPQRAYEWIKDAILDGRLREGEPLSENRLAQEIDISRTPVREALRALEQDGFIRTVPGKGAFVTGISMEDMKEIYDIRILLEPLAARTAADRIPAEKLRDAEERWLDLRERHRRGEEIAWKEVSTQDHSLHDMIIEYSSNNRLRQILLMLHAQIERFQLLSARSLADVAESIAQHLEILDCLKLRDREAIQALLTEHIRSSEENILNKYLRE
jgi:DNA-binding GntR family transcriptional regulator